MLADKLEAAKNIQKLYNHTTALLCKKWLGNASHAVKMTRFSTAHFGKFLKLIVGQHDEKWLILLLNNKLQKHTKYQRRRALYANTNVRT